MNCLSSVVCSMQTHESLGVKADSSIGSIGHVIFINLVNVGSDLCRTPLSAVTASSSPAVASHPETSSHTLLHVSCPCKACLRLLMSAMALHSHPGHTRILQAKVGRMPGSIAVRNAFKLWLRSTA